MPYKLKLNNKTFDAIDVGNRSLILLVEDKFDVIYFKKWQDRSKNGASKKDYIEDVDFVKITEKGILKHCFPILNENETMVELYYDFKELI